MLAIWSLVPLPFLKPAWTSGSSCPWIKANWKWSNRRRQEWMSIFFGISELKWTGMGEFNSDDHYIYYYGKESLRRDGASIIVNKRVWNAVLGCNLKDDRMISVCFQGKPCNITIIQVYAPTSNAEEAEVEWLYEDLQDLLELMLRKDVLSSRVLECKRREARDNWSNRQVWYRSTKWNRAKANNFAERIQECQGPRKYIFQQ